MRRTPFPKTVMLVLCLLAPLSAAAGSLDLSIVTGSAATGTPTFTQDLTDSTTFAGASPKAAIVFSSRATAENTNTGGGLAISMGFVAGGHEAGIGVFDNDAVSTNTAARVGHDTQGYSVIGSSGATDGDANLSLIANGVRLSWTDQSNGEIVKAILIGGSVEANVVTKVGGNTTSAQTVSHGLSGTPDFIIALQPGAIGNNTEATGNAHFAAGFWTAGAQNTYAQIADQSGQTSVTASAKIDSTHAIGQVGSSAMTWTGGISNVTSSSFDVTTSTANTNVMYFLAVRSTSGSALVVKTGTFLSKATTGTNADISGMSAPPKMVLSIGTQLAALDTFSSSTPADALSLQGELVNSGSGSTQYATSAISNRDGLATSGTHAFSQSSNTEGIRILSFDGTADIEATVNSWDSGGVTHNYTNIASTAGQGEVVYLAIGSVATPPTFSAAPSLSSTTTSGYVLAATPSATSIWYEVATVKGSSAPTCTQVKAGQNAAGGAALASASKSVTGADTLTLTGLTFPTHNLNGCLSNGGGDSAVSTLSNQFKTAPTGKTDQVLASVSATSFCNSISSPAAAVSDVVEFDSLTTPGSNAVTMLNDCNLSFPSDGSRQSLQYQIYDDSAGGFMAGGPGTLWFNNQAPNGPGSNLIFAFPLNQAITPVDLRPYWTDPEGDAITVTAVDALPTGLSISGSSLTGTPTAGGIFVDKALLGTDVAGDSDTGLATYLIGDITVPNVVTEPVGQAITDLQAAYFSFALTTQCSATAAAGNVISQNPAASSSATPFTDVSLAISTGLCGGRSFNMGLRLKVK